MRSGQIIGPRFKTPDSAASVSYLGGFGLSDSNTAIHTFAGVSLGNSSIDRTLIIPVASRPGAGGQITSLTVAGITATIDTSNPGANAVTSIGRVNIPAGVATGDIVVTFPGALWQVGGQIYEATNGVSPLASDSVYLTGTIASGVLGLPTANGGFVVALAAIYGDIKTFTWTGVTENRDVALSQLSESSGVADTTGATQQVEATLNTSHSHLSLSMVSYT
jgi:hypothetical protein